MSVSGVSTSEHWSLFFKPVVKSKEKAATQYLKQNAMAKRPLNSAAPWTLHITGAMLLFSYTATLLPETQVRDACTGSKK